MKEEKMEKPQAGDKTFANVLDYIDAADWINHVLGYDQRDAHRRFAPGDPAVDENDDTSGQQDGGQYLDFWHYVLEGFIGMENMSNDSMARYGPYSFADFAARTETKFGVENWRTQIAKVWAAEYPDEYELWFCW